MAASYTFEDLSGTATSDTGNPYDGLINACHNDSVRRHEVSIMEVCNFSAVRDPGPVHHTS